MKPFHPAKSGWIVAGLLALMPMQASAHLERPVTFPPGTGSIPVYRTDGPRLLVCKDDVGDFERRIAAFPDALKRLNVQLFGECLAHGFRHLQDAVDHVDQPGTRIQVLPGLYLEERGRTDADPACSALTKRRVLFYEEQRACPHVQNWVGIFGIRDLQVEGMGASPGDVVFDGRFEKLNVIRADRSDGIYFRNFTVQGSQFNGLYILETDGFVIDHMVGRWNDEYGFLTFASDHGLYTDCEAYGNGDSGIYPGGTSDINRNHGSDVPRYAIEVTRCHSYHNAIGYSGTGGDSVFAHDNEFDANSAGVTMDSAFPNHPGLPQNHARFERNRIHANNTDFYRYIRDGTCARPYAERGVENGTVCPSVGVPVGTGLLVAGGDYNLFRDNWVYDNWRAGFMLFWVPAFIRNENALGKQADTSHHNRYLANHMGISPSGDTLPNGTDFWWDGQGDANCWQGNGSVTVDPPRLPSCAQALATKRYAPDPGSMTEGVICSLYDRRTLTIPPLCTWVTQPARSALLRVAVTPNLPLALLQALLLIPVAGGLARRLRSRRGLVAAGVAGAALVVVGSAIEGHLLGSLGLTLLAGWLLATGGQLRVLRPGLGWLTVALGVAFLLEAIDPFVGIPLLPVAPAWVRLVIELVWIGWVAAVLVRSRAVGLAPQRHGAIRPRGATTPV